MSLIPPTPCCSIQRKDEDDDNDDRDDSDDILPKGARARYQNNKALLITNYKTIKEIKN